MVLVAIAGLRLIFGRYETYCGVIASSPRPEMVNVDGLHAILGSTMLPAGNNRVAGVG